MSEAAAGSPKTRQPRWSAIAQNPVAIKELRSRMRGRRAFVVLTSFLLVMSGLISLVYIAFASSTGGYGPEQQLAGKFVFAAVLSMQVILVIFIGPAFTAGSISGEKERQTYDLLRTTLLSASSFVLGKLISALSYVMLLIVASIPLLSIAFLLGGISPIELLVSQLLIIVSAVTFALYGMFCSTLMRSTLAASVVTFAGSLFFTVGLPILVLLGVSLLGSTVFFASGVSSTAELVMAFGGLALAATNLPATLIVSEIFLVQEDALFFFKTSVGGSSVWLFSPWPWYLLLYLLLALLFFWACVRRIRKISEG